MLPDQTWKVFDDLVQRIGPDGTWEYAVIRQRRHYEDLVEAGFLARSPERTLEMYGLTTPGRREVCRRVGQHNYDRHNPALNGCQTCDATPCGPCAGYGSVPGRQRGRRPSRVNVPCEDCDATGLAESA